MMKKIDTHLHITYDGLGIKKDSFHIAEANVMKDYMDTHHVEHGIILPGGEFYEIYGGNMDVCAIAHQYPETFSWLCNIDIENLDDVEERLIRYKALGAKGVGEFTKNCYFDDPRLEAVLSISEKLEMPFLFHMSPRKDFNYGVVDDIGLPRLEGALAKFPNLQIVGHSQPFWYEIGGDMPQDNDSRNEYPSGPVKPGGRVPELFRKYPNLYGDLSANSAGNAIMRDPEFGYAFLEEFQDRLMFATDMTNTDMYFPLGDFLDEAVEKGKISATVYRKICRENAIRLFNLDLV
ncbi:putative TIM-barrel fold metal-dependent hydrolase [Virgibacillus halotolerans]|uniref:amidohydrolase family protein n=1 Tax=Virgibacillus halotolerans TaxID=1071053 RepID=UPI00195FDD9B|nr:amidohydrolase family protein [Virgibacillus halotolerans]MBM7599236.1 putative TIM-barrel fold metal-dependent hydrolase [Virgibacillus halotolerans]